ncbi:MAG TPA: PAS domain-containing protein [Pararhizobium sp.]|uniref:helix-turn-helix transcriptional regulator n=1 Tax=Pararhizobium sp. TaxID=1977563 RepID=UPI002C685A56|nr:PAS domain-containing protein [Pararhizobium sp.]HTO31522.1 PAS domain-containing protein [Pararhizobium sp.]
MGKHIDTPVAAAELAPYYRVCDAIALLLQPHAEVVIHDLKSDTVCHISNNFSKRVIGEPSLLDETDFKPTETIIGPYEKVNWDGRRIKSVSIVLHAEERAIGVLCINVDVTHIHAAMQVLGSLASVPVDQDKPAALFKEDWHERVNEYIKSWTTHRGIAVADLGRSEKQELIRALADDGAFEGKHAAAYISRILGMGRATVYNYLKVEQDA